MSSTTWRKLITEAMEDFGESIENAESITFGLNENMHYLDEDERAELPDVTDIEACLDRKFDSGYGGAEGFAFTLWTKERVYFPVCYDGSEWVESVPREPNGEATEHVGGG